MGKGQWQHYLPEVFLKGFAAPSGEVWRYDREAGTLKALGTPVIGAERDLYTLVTGDEISRAIESEWFSPLDGTFGPIRRKIDNNENLSASELQHLANFVAYLRVRTPSMIRETETRFRQMNSLVGADRDSIKYHSEQYHHGLHTFVLGTEQNDKVSPDRAESDLRNEVLTSLIKSGVHLSTAIFQLEWSILVAPRERSFIVGDNPFVIVPPKSHDMDGDGVGPMTPGATVFVPLSSQLCLRFTNLRRSRIIRRKADGATVRVINSCSVLNSEQYLFSPSKILLEKLVANVIDKPGRNTVQVVFREAPSLSDPSRSLGHWFTRSRIGPEWAGRLHPRD